MTTTPADRRKQWLFTYGTLRDPEIQQILFGGHRPSEMARLSGWLLCASDEDGYLFIRPEPTTTVIGAVIELDATMLAIADQWEEVPRYQREKVQVQNADGTCREAWAYTQRNGHGAIYSGTETSLLDRQTVLAAAELFKRQDHS